MRSNKKEKSNTKSNTKLEWEKILNNKNSRKLLSSSWNTPNPNKTFSDSVKKILKTASGKKNKN